MWGDYTPLAGAGGNGADFPAEWQLCIQDPGLPAFALSACIPGRSSAGGHRCSGCANGRKRMRAFASIRRSRCCAAKGSRGPRAKPLTETIHGEGPLVEMRGQAAFQFHDEAP